MTATAIWLFSIASRALPRSTSPFSVPSARPVTNICDVDVTVHFLQCDVANHLCDQDLPPVHRVLHVLAMITVDIILSTGSARESGSRTRKMTKLFRFHIRRKVKSHNARITGDAWMTASVMDDDVRAKKGFFANPTSRNVRGRRECGCRGGGNSFIIHDFVSLWLR